MYVPSIVAPKIDTVETGMKSFLGKRCLVLPTCVAHTGMGLQIKVIVIQWFITSRTTFTNLYK